MISQNKIFYISNLYPSQNPQVSLYEILSHSDQRFDPDCVIDKHTYRATPFHSLWKGVA